MAADNSAAGLTAQLDEVWTSLAELAGTLDDEEWTASTPCPGWNVAAQYAHVIGTESMLLGRPNPEVDAGRPGHVRNDIGGFNEVWVAALAGEKRQSVLERLAEVTDARRKQLAGMSEDDFSKSAWTPVGQADYRRFMQIRVFDCWVHEQDVRDGIGRPGHEEGPVAEQAADEIVRALGYIVGKKAGAPDGARVRIELTGPVSREVNVAVDGRAKVVEDLGGAATTTVRLPFGVFTRLACGRIQPSSAEGVSFSGDTELGQRLVDNLTFTI